MKRKYFLAFSLIFLIGLLSSFNAFIHVFTAEEINSITINDTDYSKWYWTEIEEISTQNDHAWNCEIAIDVFNNIHIVWEDDSDDFLSSGTDWDIFYRKWNFDTGTWSSIELVSTESTESSRFSKIAIDSKGHVHVAWTDFTDYLGAGIDLDVFHRSRSPSGTWSSYSLISDISTGSAQEIDISFDSYDNIYIVWSDATDVGDLGGTDLDIFLNVFDEDNSTWSGMRLVTEESSLASIESCIAVDVEDFIHLVWTDDDNLLGSGTDYDIFHKKYMKELDVWSTTEVVSTESSGSSRDCFMALDSENSIHVVWYDNTDYLGSGTEYDIFYKFYDSTLSSWTTTEVLSIFGNTYAALPDIAIDTDDTIHIVWEDKEDYDGTGTDWDIVYQYKEKSSNVWSQLYFLSLTPDSSSYVPRIAIDQFNHIHLVWYDLTNHITADSDYDIFYRKFVGPPESTVLHTFDSDNIEVGNLTLSWEEVTAAEEYDIYRDTSYITSVSSLTAIETTSQLSFIDTLESSGEYYYAVVAANRYGDADHSNVESILVVDPPIEPGLFESLDLGQTLVIAGILGGFQLILAVVIIVLFKVAPSPRSGKKK